MIAENKERDDQKDREMMKRERLLKSMKTKRKQRRTERVIYIILRGKMEYKRSSERGKK